MLAAGLRGVRRRKVTRRLRAITRALGGVREIDVSLAALGEEARAAQADAVALDAVRARLQGMRQDRRGPMLAAIAAIDVPKLVGRVRRMAGLAADPAHEAVWRGRLAARLTRRAEALAEAVRDAGALYVPERLHRARIAAKKLRYTLELAGEAGATGTRPLLRNLKRTQDTLGRLHDLQVLGRHVAALEAGSGAAHVVSTEALAPLARALDAECRARHARYVAAGAGLLAICAAVRTTIAPGVAPAATARLAPLKMTLEAARRRAASDRPARKR